VILGATSAVAEERALQLAGINVNCVVADGAKGGIRAHRKKDAS
jgi:hypothetical protein